MAVISSGSTQAPAATAAGNDASAAAGGSPDGALFAALMIQSAATSASGKASASTAAASSDLPIRFAVNAGAKAPTDSALEDFAVQMGIDRSLAHLLLTQTGEPSAAVGLPPTGQTTATASGAANSVVTPSAGTLSNLLWANNADKSLTLTTDVSAKAISSGNAPTTVPVGQSATSLPFIGLNDAKSGITDLNAVSALSDEDLLKAKKLKLKNSSALPAASTAADPMMLLQKLSVEAHAKVDNVEPVDAPENSNGDSTAVDRVIANSGSAAVSVNSNKPPELPPSTESALGSVFAKGSAIPLSDPSTVPNGSAIGGGNGVASAAGVANVVNSVANPAGSVPVVNVATATSPLSNSPKTAGSGEPVTLPSLSDLSQNASSLKVSINSTSSPQNTSTEPGISSQEWLRSLGAVTTPADSTMSTSSSSLAAQTSDSVGSNLSEMVAAAGDGIGAKAVAKGKAAIPGAARTVDVAADDVPQALQSVTFGAATKSLSGLVTKDSAPLPPSSDPSVRSLNGVDPNPTFSVASTNNAGAASSDDSKAQTLLNTPIELPQPDKSYDQRMDEFSAQVASRLLAQVKTEKYSVNLKVTPENLGPIAISLSVEGNKLSAHFGTAVPEVSALLKAALPNLKDNLESQGFNLGTTSFAQSGSGSGFGSMASNQNSAGNNSSSATVPNVAVPSDATTEPATSVEPSTHVLDVYA